MLAKPLAAAIPLLLLGSALAAQRPITIADQMRLRSVTDAAISPDGSRVAYRMVEVDSANDRRTRTLWLVNSSGGEPQRIGEGWEQGVPRWSPDGASLGYLARVAGVTQLLVWSDGAVRQATTSRSDLFDFQWSPDGQSVAYTADSTLPATTPPGISVAGTTNLRSQLYHFVLESGAVRRLTSVPGVVDDFSWSPDGSAIAFAHRPAATVRSLILETDISVVSLADTAVRSLVHRAGMDISPRWSPDGSQVAFIAHGGKTDWIGNTDIYLVPAAGGVPRNVTPQLGERILPDEFILSWRRDSRALYFTVPRPESNQLIEIDAVTAASRDLTPPKGVRASYSFSADGRTMAFLETNPSMPWELFVSPVDSFASRRLTRSNPQLEMLTLGTMREVTWRGRDGLAMSGLMLVPPGHTPGKRYPVLVYLHGGPAWFFSAGFGPHGGLPGSAQAEMQPAQVLAGMGYLVFMPNPRGSLGRGEAFRRANVRNWGEGDLADVIAGLDTLIAQGIADGKRAGVMGYSYGGALTAYAITNSNRFLAAQIGGGISDPAMMFAETDAPDLVRAYFGGAPWEAPEVYRRLTPLNNVAKITVPTLIIHGEADRRVPPSQARGLYRALQERKIPSELVTYAATGHGIARPSFQRDGMERTVRWFRRWIPVE